MWPVRLSTDNRDVTFHKILRDVEIIIIVGMSYNAVASAVIKLQLVSIPISSLLVVFSTHLSFALCTAYPRYLRFETDNLLCDRLHTRQHYALSHYVRLSVRLSSSVPPFISRMKRSRQSNWAESCLYITCPEKSKVKVTRSSYPIPVKMAAKWTTNLILHATKSNGSNVKLRRSNG